MRFIFSNRSIILFFFFSSRRRHTICSRDWSSDVCSSDLVAGSFIRGGMRFTPLRLIDSAGGLLLGGAIGLAIVWVGASVALLTPGRTAFRQQVERSAIVKQLDSALPPRTLLNLLARIDPFPSIVGPKAPTLPPSKGVLRDPSIRAATTRIVKVLGTACGVGVEGSGWLG